MYQITEHVLLITYHIYANLTYLTEGVKELKRKHEFVGKNGVLLTEKLRKYSRKYSHFRCSQTLAIIFNRKHEFLGKNFVPYNRKTTVTVLLLPKYSVRT